MSKNYVAYNGADPTTAALSPITTGTSIKTLMQLQWPSGGPTGRVIEWGISFDGVAATPIKCELIQTDVAATVSAYSASGVMPYSDPNSVASAITLGTANSGFTASVEGTTTVSRLFDYQLVAQQYVKQFPLGREPEVLAAKFLRVRVTAASALNAVCYISWEE